MHIFCLLVIGRHSLHEIKPSRIIITLCFFTRNFTTHSNYFRLYCSQLGCSCFSFWCTTTTGRLRQRFRAQFCAGIELVKLGGPPPTLKRPWDWSTVDFTTLSVPSELPQWRLWRIWDILFESTFPKSQFLKRRCVIFTKSLALLPEYI